MGKTICKIHPLGTASGIPTANRYNESVVVIVNRDVYLLNAGEPCSASLVRRGIDHNKIKAIFISHMHADHFGGFPMLISLTELAHIQPEELFKYLSSKEIPRIICLHLHPKWEGKEKRILSVGKKYLTKGSLSIGYDGMELKIS